MKNFLKKILLPVLIALSIPVSSAFALGSIAGPGGIGTPTLWQMIGGVIKTNPLNSAVQVGSLTCTGTPCGSGGGGGGLVSINGDSTALQLLTTGTSGSNFGIVDAGSGSHIINLPTASGTNTGKLSSSDWTSFNSRVLRSGDTMTGALDMSNNNITSLASPINPADAANKSYVDSFVTGLSWKTFVQNGTVAALPTNVYANGAGGVGATLTESVNGAFPATIDGYANTVGDRILVIYEATAANNGIYTVTSLGGVGSKWVLTRATDNDQSSEMTNATVFVANGTAVTGNLGLSFTQTNPTPTMGTTAINWVIFANNIYTAGSGLSLSTNVFSLNVAHSNNWTAAQTFDSGIFKLQGSTSGILTMSAANTTTPYAVKWPNAQGSASTVLTNDGAGNLSWAAGAGTVASVANSDGSLVVSPTTGSVVASLDVSHANLWTALQTFNAQGITTLPTARVTLSNTTTASLAVPVQYSPALEFTGKMWQSGNSTSHTGSFRMYEIPVNGVAAGATHAGTLQIDSSKDGSYTTNILNLSRIGLLTTAQGYIATSGSIIASTGSIISTAGQVQAGTDLLSGTNGGTAGHLYMYGSTSGNLSIAAPAVVTNYGFVLPGAAPSAFANSQIISASGTTSSAWVKASVTVAQAESLAQTGTVASVATYTPTLGGEFRIGGYLNVTAISATSILLKVAYTDASGSSQTQSFYPMGATVANVSTTGPVAYPAFDIRVANGAAITVTATVTGVSTTYDVGATITSLN